MMQYGEGLKMKHFLHALLYTNAHKTYHISSVQ